MFPGRWAPPRPEPHIAKALPSPWPFLLTPPWKVHPPPTITISQFRAFEQRPQGLAAGREQRQDTHLVAGPTSRLSFLVCKTELAALTSTAPGGRGGGSDAQTVQVKTTHADS